MKKEIFLLFTEFPFGSNRYSEKLRMALGLSLNDNNAMRLVFAGNGRRALQDLDEASAGVHPISKNIKMLGEMGARFFVEKKSEVSFAEGLSEKFENFEPSGLEDILESADVVIT